MEVKTTIAVEKRARDRDQEEIPKVIALAVVEATKGIMDAFFQPFVLFILN
jgi:hypothetical protein